MIKLVRLDYRLVHGQILAAWVNHLSAQRIIWLTMRRRMTK